MSSFSVFVGNIAPNVAEEDLVDLFSQVGRVRAARLARDKETGRAKQFGFIDFDDHETCLSAMRNLNGADLKGRPLRVDVRATSRPRQRGGGPGRRPAAGRRAAAGGQDRRPSPPPRDKAAEAWARMLGELPEERVTVMHEGELWQLVSNAQPLVATDVDAARRALVAKPTAALALLRAQIRLGMVSGQAISAVMAREQQQQQQQQQAQYQQQQQQQHRQHAGPPPGHYRRTCSSSSSSSSSSGAGRRRSSTAGRRKEAAGSSSSRNNTTSSSSRGRADRSTRSRRRSCSRCRC